MKGSEPTNSKATTNTRTTKQVTTEFSIEQGRVRPRQHLPTCILSEKQPQERYAYPDSVQESRSVPDRIDSCTTRRSFLARNDSGMAARELPAAIPLRVRTYCMEDLTMMSQRDCRVARTSRRWQAQRCDWGTDVPYAHGICSCAAERQLQPASGKRRQCGSSSEGESWRRPARWDHGVGK
jgi:hypothetical protein